MRIFFLLSVLACTAFGCKSTKDAGSGDTAVVSILHGTSFGHCIGYCVKEELYTPSSLVYTQFNRDSVNNPKKVYTETVTESDFVALVKTIDFKKWEALPERIGCPDCADGGAEYIELVMANGQRKQVMFDAHSNPEGLEQLLVQLRGKRKLMERSERNGG